MAQGHDDAHGHDSPAPDAHDAHAAHGGHGPAPAPKPEGPPPPHVVSIARGTQWLGLFLWGTGALLTLWYLWRGPWSCCALAAVASVYGFSVWLAARDTIRKAETA